MPQSECEWIRSQLTHLYHVHWTHLDLAPWAEMHRRRVWLFLVCRDVAATDVAVVAVEVAGQIQKERRACPARPFRSVLYPPGHPRWSQVLTGCLRNDAGPRRHGDKWRQRCQALRDQWRRSGFPWADDHPLAGAALWGCAKTTRVIEVLEVSLLRACWKKGLDPRRPEELLEAKKGVWCDYSQSFLTASPGGPGTVNTSSRLYDYVLDRIIVPEELLRALGWSEGVVDTSGVDMAHMQNLVGECQALQPLSVASWALLLAVGNGIPGMWCTAGDNLARQV